MKHIFERNLKIVNELMNYLHNLGAKEINTKINTNDSGTSFTIWGNVIDVPSEEIDNLTNTLNIERQHEIEESYWYLGGEDDSDGELSLVGVMIDSAEITYVDNILCIKIYRSEV
ncbi:MAG: hypothetical protein IJO26_05525 [Clostridium sp.]|nr:hypothetical protein [Clostridium sp.]